MDLAVYQQFFDLERDHWWFVGMRDLCRSTIETIQTSNGLVETKRCIDVGCGAGLWTQELSRFGDVSGLDIAPEALAFCRARGLSRLIRASAEELPVADASCDLITALGVIEHLDDDRAFLQNVRRALRPGGHVVLLTSAYKSLWSHHDDVVHHKRRYRRTELTQLLRAAGLEPVKVTYANMFLLPVVLAVRSARKLNPFARAVEGTPDVFLPAPIINSLLTRVLLAESRIIHRVPLPFGIGLLAAARRA
jgi:SAM-dependent methyltransferase